MAHSDRTPSSKPSSVDESEELFRVLLDGVFEGVLIHDSVIHYANLAATRITGYSHGELLGMPVKRMQAKFSSDDDLDFDGFQSPAEGLTYGPVVFAGVGAAGKERSIEAQGRTVLYRGRWLWLSAFRDVTRARQTEDALRRRVEFEDLLTSISTSFINLPHQEVDRALDEAMERIARFEDVDRSYIYLVEGEILRATNMWSVNERFVEWKNRTTEIGDFRWAIDKLVAGESVVYEVVERYAEPKPDGETGRLRSSVCVPMHARGQLFGYVGFDALREAKQWSDETVRLLRTVGSIFASVLERRRVQEELDEAYATMEQTVESRTLELRQKQAQLVQAEKMAALGQLVAGVAHEINTPLGAIKSNADTIMRSFDRMGDIVQDLGEGKAVGTEKLDKLLTAARKLNDVDIQAIDRIAGIVSSLRQFARLDQAELDTLDVHEALDNTLTLVHHQFKHRITVERDYGEVPPIECHPQQINQVIMNLLVNAGQAIDGNGTVRIRTRSDGKVVTVEIGDDGKGMDPEVVQRIFDPGFTTKGVGVGTGLGLSIVHQIIDEHQGKISVSSEPGKGSTFRVEIPIEHRDT